jgi:hypothetical protein
MRKLLKYLLVILSVVFFAIGAISCSDSSEQSFNLLSKEISLMVGAKTQIAYENEEKNKLTFTSSDIETVSVSDTGEISALKSGVALVSVECKNQIEICKVIVLDTDAYIDVGCSEYSMVVGSSVTLQAKAYLNGNAFLNETKWSISDAATENYTLTQNENDVTFSASSVGYYTLKASNEYTEAQCRVKVLNENARRADSPVVTIEHCDTLQWNTVNGLENYKIYVEGQNEIVVKGTSYSISDFIDADALPYGKSLNIMVSAYAENNFDYIDSYYTKVAVSHDYALNETVDATCYTIGTMVYTCKDCNRSYTDNAYLEEHNYVKGTCSVCNAYKTEGVLYFYDDNFIPMPTPAEASDSQSEWRIKYSDYYTEEDTTSSTKLWLAVSSNQDDIPEEKRIECYYVHGLKDNTLETVYITEYYNDGVHGKLPVKYVRGGAFSRNDVVKNVILPEGVTEIRGASFSRSKNLETVVMPGVKYMPAIDAPQYNYGMGAFINCYGLKSVVVGDSFINDALSFRDTNFTGNEKWSVDIYVWADTIEGVELLANPDYVKFNQLITGVSSPSISGKMYAYHDDNGTYCEDYWHYDENGLPVVDQHEFKNNGDCIHCGATYSDKVNYGYDSNFIPMPSPSAWVKNTETLVFTATDIDVEWKAKYEKYVPEGVDKSTLEKPEQWWKAVFDGRKAIPENERIKCYYVKGTYDVTKQSYVIPETYKGAQGTLPIKYVGYNAFSSNKHITEFIATETLTELRGASFYACSSLQTVSLPGLKYLPGHDLYMFPYHYRMANFDSCDNLTKLVVAGEFKANGNHFRYSNSTQVTDKVQLYVYADNINNVIHKMSDPYAKWNKLLTDTKYIYDDVTDGIECSDNTKWHFDENGRPVRNAHDIENGVCKNCGMIEMKTIAYAYDDNFIPMPNYGDIKSDSAWRVKYEKYVPSGTDKSTLTTPELWYTAVYNNRSSITSTDKVECYYITGLVDTTLTEISIPSTYNDGVHGELPIKYAKWGAFGGKGLVKVVATETFTELRGRVFASCTSLKTAILPGVKYLSGLYKDYEDPLMHCQNFNGCSSLTKIVVADGFRASGVNFSGTSGGKIAIYQNGTTASSSTNLWIGSTYQRNALLSEKIFKYDATGTLDDSAYWHYAENGEPVHNKHVDSNTDGKCDWCLDIIE